MGFGGVAEATTLNGEVTLAEAVGFDTVSGKSFEPVPHAAVDGLSAVGAGSLLVLGVQVIGTGGVVGKEGAGVGVGVGVGVGLFVAVELEPQPASSKLSPINIDNPNKTFALRTETEMGTAPIDILQTTNS